LRTIGELSRGMAAGQRYARGIFCGGTFCFEAQLIHAAAGIPAFSNAPTAGNRKLEHVRRSQHNTIIDMGDDEFTQGRPHPMIDPSLRDARIREEVADDCRRPVRRRARLWLCSRSDGGPDRRH
jgi:hypothetical protein